LDIVWYLENWILLLIHVMLNLMKKLLFPLLIVHSTLYILHLEPAFAETVKLEDAYAFGKVGSFGALASKIVPVIFAFASVVVMVYFAVGAFKWIMSGGDKAQVEAARQMLTHSVIGIFLLVVLFLVVQFLPQALGLENYTIFKR
jgi:hypothetical protein